jgi:hypothetical protein
VLKEQLLYASAQKKLCQLASGIPIPEAAKSFGKNNLLKWL